MRGFQILREDIIPLLEEYCYEDYATLEAILGRGLVDRESQRINDELFEPSQQDNLIQALLAPAPEIMSTGRAIEAEEEAESEMPDETDEDADLDDNESDT